MRGQGLHVTKAVAVAAAFVFGAAVTPVSAQACQTPQAAWTACQSNADCVVMPGVCGNWVAYNAAHHEDMDIHIICEQAMVKCAPPPQDRVAPPAVCSAGVCQVSAVGK